MRLAAIAVTKRGGALAARLARELPGTVTVYVKAGRAAVDGAEEFDSLGELIGRIFDRYEGLIFIMATGIVVRVIAPHIRDKRHDPAVVVLGDDGHHVISLLSGHLGGANALAIQISRTIGAEAVITTATDLAQRPAPDVLAKQLDFALEPFAQLKTVNAVIANDGVVKYFLDDTLPGQAAIRTAAAELGICWESLAQLAQPMDAAVILSDKLWNAPVPHIYIRPPVLAVGVGCRRGTTAQEIRQAIEQVLTENGRSLCSIAVLGSSVVKSDEAGLLETGTALQVPLRFFNNDELQDTIDQQGLGISSFVKQEIGVGNVCEAAALLAGQSDKLLVHKQKIGRVTVALALSK